MTSAPVSQHDKLRDRLAAVVAATLRVSVASVESFGSFASLGMDSLAAVELTAAIEDELGIELPLTAVHEHPTLDALCRFIEEGGNDASNARRLERLLGDAVLPNDITPDASTPVLTRDARHVLLTGATGFVGVHLLRTLVDETGATIHCLIRPSSNDGFTRLRRNLVRYGLWSAELTARIRVVEGDLAEPLLGLASQDFRALAHAVDAIYHAAADVNWVHAYDALRDANVLGTRELLRLACEGVPKPFHFLSSTSVCHSTTGPRLVDERTDVFAGLDGLRLGYAQSKCVAEALVREAGARGLPVTIVRPSLVSGSAALGRSNIDDLTSRFIAGCIRMHAAPDLDWRMDCVPVDDVARAVVSLARAHERGMAVSHLTAPRPRHWRECVLWMRLSGYDVELLPYAEWCDVLRATEDVKHPLHGLRSFFLHTIAAENHLTLPQLFEESRRSQVSALRTTQALCGLATDIRPLDSRLLSRYFDDFVEQGVVPQARGRTPTTFADAPPEPLEPSDTLTNALREWLGVTSLRVDKIRTSRVATDESIVAELTAWRANTQSGLFDACVTWSDDSGRRGATRLFVKAKAADAQMIEVAEALGALSSPALGQTVARFRDDLGLTRSHERELALYRVADARLRAHTPRALVVERNDAQRRWLLALESIDEALLINATDAGRWDDVSIDVALTGLAQIHSVWYTRESALASEPWLAPRRDSAKRIEMSPLWAALAEHAHERSSAFGDHRLRRIHERLVAGVSSWSRALDAAPQTLIHNDFNPRNIAIRRGPTGPRLSAFDWELATLGAPQRDLAELLCFVLPPDASLSMVVRWIDRYRVLLSAATETEVARADWDTGFSAALCDVLVDRFASYAMIDRVRPQRFLPRVVRSWLNIFRYFPWTG